MSDEEQDIDDTLEDDDGELIDWQLPLCFMKKRHREKIEGINCLPQSWRMKERVWKVDGLARCWHVLLPLPEKQLTK